MVLFHIHHQYSYSSYFLFGTFCSCCCTYTCRIRFIVCIMHIVWSITNIIKLVVGICGTFPRIFFIFIKTLTKKELHSNPVQHFKSELPLLHDLPSLIQVDYELHFSLLQYICRISPSSNISPFSFLHGSPVKSGLAILYTCLCF